MAGGGLTLASDAFYDFVAQLKKLASVHPTAQAIKLHMTVHLGLAQENFPVFPHIDVLLGTKLKREELIDIICGTYKVLTQIGRIVNNFKSTDRGLLNLNETWKKTLSAKDKNEKGKLLEGFLSMLISRDENFLISEKDLKTESEELDIVVENIGSNPFFQQLNCPLIIFECKNWSSKVTASEVRNFAQKIQNRPRRLCNIGVLVTVSELTRDAAKELIGYRGKDFLMAIIDKDKIENLLKNRIPFGQVLKDSIKEAGFK